MSFVRSLVSTTRYLRPTSSLRPLRSIHTSKALFAADPFPFSLDPSLISSTGQKSDGKEEWPLPEPLDRSHEDESALRARLVYQTRKRGTLETDLLLSTFARDQLGSMSVAELKQFDKLLDEPDWDIFYWAVEKREPPAKWKDTELLEKLKIHARNEGKVVRMMPELMQRAPEQ